MEINPHVNISLGVTNKHVNPTNCQKHHKALSVCQLVNLKQKYKIVGECFKTIAPNILVRTNLLDHISYVIVKISKGLNDLDLNVL